MIEGFNFMTGEWVEQKATTLRKLVEEASRPDRPCKLIKTNQDSFEWVYFYYTDCMGHDWWYRMTNTMEDMQFNTQWNEMRIDQLKDYPIYTNKQGYKTETSHLICGRCRRCKTCKDCICEDNHIINPVKK